MYKKKRDRAEILRDILLNLNKPLLKTVLMRKANLTAIYFDDHMAILINKGLVLKTISGRYIKYSITNEGRGGLKRLNNFIESGYLK